MFLIQYLMNPKAVGAIMPSSRFLATKMMESIDFQKAKCIVEYGPGTGVFTEKMMERRNPGTVILLVENNKEFYALLKEKYKDEENVFIEYGSAEQIERYVRKYDLLSVDYVVSGLPFASLPKEVSTYILDHTAKILNKEGKFITFQYTKLKKAFIAQFFTKIESKREYRNVPPAYIFTCQNMEECRGVKNTHCG